MRVRRAAWSDLSVLEDFTRQEAVASDGLVLGAIPGIQLALSSDDLGAYWIGELKGEVVAALCTGKEWSDWNSAYYLYIAFVFVVPHMRGRGLFQELWKQVVDLPRET